MESSLKQVGDLKSDPTFILYVGWWLQQNNVVKQRLSFWKIFKMKTVTSDLLLGWIFLVSYSNFVVVLKYWGCENEHANGYIDWENFLCIKPKSNGNKTRLSKCKCNQGFRLFETYGFHDNKFSYLAIVEHSSP